MSRPSKLNQDLVNQACNALVATQTKITIANIRAWLMAEYGFSGNNNDLCPMVAFWKDATKASLKTSRQDVDAETVNFVAGYSTQLEIPVDLKLNCDRLIQMMYTNVYDSVDSQVGSERIQEMQAEIDRLSANQEEYYRMKAEWQAMEKVYQPLIDELAKANRLLDMQKVAAGEKLVEEMEETQKRYDAIVSESADLKAQLEYARARNNELGNHLAEKTEQNQNLVERVADLESALVQVQDQPTENPAQVKALIERNAELLDQLSHIEERFGMLEFSYKALLAESSKPQMMDTQSHAHAALNMLSAYLNANGKDSKTIDQSRKAADKELYALSVWLRSQVNQLDIPLVEVCQEKI